MLIYQFIDGRVLDAELHKINTHQSNVQKYSEVASWNFEGKHSMGQGGGLGVTTEVSGWIDGYVDLSGGKVTIAFNDAAIKHYKDIIVQCPRYPFPYYCLAKVYKARNDPVWKNFARQATAILEITTTIPSHSDNHDVVLKDLKTLLGSESNK